ncbi:hypothetical protein CJF25_15080 [Photobacterium phosphoreum]|nr:hypothetical protein [Photobacterium phosphoreum]
MKDCSAQFELFIELLHKLQNRVGVKAQKRGKVVRESRDEGEQGRIASDEIKSSEIKTALPRP